MDADRHVEAAGLFIQREEIRVAGSAPVALDALLEHAAGAMVFRPAQLLDRAVHREEREHRHPAQPAVAPGGPLGHPAVVRPGDGQLGLGPSTERAANERRGIQNLDIDAQLIHVSNPGIYIDQLSSHLGRTGPLVIAPAAEPDLAVGDSARFRSFGEPESMRPSIV